MGEQRSGVTTSVAGLIAAGAVLVGFMGGLGVGCTIGSSATSDPRPGSQDLSGLSDYRSVTAAPTTSSAPAVAPTPADFRIDVAITEQKCFGSAGCSYELAIAPVQVTAKDITGKWTVVYQITGGDEPQTGNFTLTGSQANWDAEKRIRGSAGATFGAEITQIVRAY